MQMNGKTFLNESIATVKKILEDMKTWKKNFVYGHHTEDRHSLELV